MTTIVTVLVVAIGLMAGLLVLTTWAAVGAYRTVLHLEDRNAVQAQTINAMQRKLDERVPSVPREPKSVHPNDVSRHRVEHRLFGGDLSARMPTPAERRALGLDENGCDRN